MIELTKRSLPNVIRLMGRDFSVYTDFRVWMRFAIEVRKIRGSEGIDVSYLFKNDMPAHCDLRPLLEFAFPKKEIPRAIGGGSDAVLIDYEIDADLIYAAFMGQYGIDLLTTDMHWYVFQALLSGLNDSTKLREVMGYRAYTPHNNDKKTDQYERLRVAWEIVYETPEEEAETQAFLAKFEKRGT